MKTTARNSAWSMFANMSFSSSASPPVHDVVAGRQLDGRATAASMSRADLAQAAAVGVGGDAHLALPGPCGGWSRGPCRARPCASSRSGTSSLSPFVVVLVRGHGEREQVLRVAALVGAQPHAHVVAVALARPRSTEATSPATAARSVVPIDARAARRGRWRARGRRAPAARASPSRGWSRCRPRPASSPSAASARARCGRARPPPAPRTLIWIGFWPKGPASKRP